MTFCNVCGKDLSKAIDLLGYDVVKAMHAFAHMGSLHQLPLCTWEDCDQPAIYCAGHAKELADLQAFKETMEDAHTYIEGVMTLVPAGESNKLAVLSRLHHAIQQIKKGV